LQTGQSFLFSGCGFALGNYQLCRLQRICRSSQPGRIFERLPDHDVALVMHKAPAADRAGCIPRAAGIVMVDPDTLRVHLIAA
jgi:hypothetical protein